MTETLERWTNGRPHTSPAFIKVDLEAKVGVDSRIFSPTIGPSVEIEIETEEIIAVETIIGPTIETDPGTIIDVTIGETITGQMKDEITIDKTVGGEIATDKTIEIGKIIEEMTPDRDRSESRDRSRNYNNDSPRGRDRNRDGWVQQRSRTLQMTEKDLGPGLIQE